MTSFKGIHYYSTHRFLWPVLRARLLPCMVLSTCVLALLFTFAYVPQALFLMIFHGSAAWFNATILVLGEGAAITSILFEGFLVDETLVDVFDAVLVNEGFEDLVTVTRPVEASLVGSSPLRRLGKPHHASVYSPFSARQIFEFILLLPLNLVPWVGVPLFLWLTGYRAGPLQHYRLFKLREFSKTESKAFVKSKRLQYTS